MSQKNWPDSGTTTLRSTPERLSGAFVESAPAGSINTRLEYTDARTKATHRWTTRGAVTTQAWPSGPLNERVPFFSIISIGIPVAP